MRKASKISLKVSSVGTFTVILLLLGVGSFADSLLQRQAFANDLNIVMSQLQPHHLVQPLCFLVAGIYPLDPQNMVSTVQGQVVQLKLLG